MGNDPTTSVVDRFHRTHDVRNLFICDGSSMVTSSRGQPTETISALAFRAGEHIAAFAKRGEIEEARRHAMRFTYHAPWVGEHRIVPTASGDMAYEYGTMRMGYDEKRETQ